MVYLQNAPNGSEMSFWKELYCGLRRPMLAIACAFLAFILAMGVLTAMLGTWPPLMVVESRSMQHDDSSSAIGVIDTGDVVTVSHYLTDGGLRTYVGSMQDGYTSFGEYGDVAIFQPPGEEIPIVHRALLEVEYNATARGFDIPELAAVPSSQWSVPGEHDWRGLTDWVELYNVGYAGVTVRIDLNDTYRAMEDDPHGGLITMGDNNWREAGGSRYGIVDQGSLIKEPIRWEWVIGKVVGEVPWLGTIRLAITGTAPPYMPLNSIVLLTASIASLTVFPVALWASARAVEQRRRMD
jgi:signal peptidase